MIAINMDGFWMGTHKIENKLLLW